MNRREALTATMALMGTTIVGAHAFLTGCTSGEKPIRDFSDDIVTLLDDVGETILPTTASSPGAQTAKIGLFMKTIVTDCYDEQERSIFLSGLTTLQRTAKERYDKMFTALSIEQKHELLSIFDHEARGVENQNKEVPFFTMLNELTVWGYFSSEPGATKALRYVPVPGRYEGCIDYHTGEGAWVY